MKGPRLSKAKVRKGSSWGSRNQGGSVRERKRLTPEETEDLKDRLRKAYGREPYDFQLEAIKAQIEGTDMVVHASTGAGKTTIAAGPHTWIKDGVTLIATPLIQLAEEMVETFKNEFGLDAISIHSKNGALSPVAAKEILAGKYKVVLVSPEMMQSRSFTERLLRNRLFTRRVIALFVDEAHCISHWGAQFRKKYATLGNVRAFLPASTSVIAVSATLTARVRRDIQSKLHFSKATSSFVDIGNNRPNISVAVRACQNPMNTYTDLDFVIPDAVSSIEDIPKTWIYVDDIDSGAEIIQHLRDVLRERNPELDDTIIRPYNARLSLPYRQKAMSEFRNGDVRILVCTEAAGMGCNVPDIRVVVQWKLPGTLSNFIQRAGRAARGANQEGLAVLLVEPSVYAIALTTSDARALATQAKKARTKRTTEEKAVLKEWAVTHGVKRGGCTGNDDVPTGQQPVLDLCADDEGLLAFVQSVTCRRKLWAKIFDNAQDPGSTVACCDICVPALLQRTRPAPLTKSSATIKPLAKGLPDESMRNLLEKWRDTVFERDHRRSPLDSSAILSDDEVVNLSSVGTLTREVVEGMLKPSWLWWDRYGEELMARTEGVEATFTPMPKVSRKPKRSPADDVNEAERVAKKSRPTAVPQALEITGLATPPATAQQLLRGTPVTTHAAHLPNTYTGDYYPTEYPYRSQMPVQVSNSQVHGAYRNTYPPMTYPPPYFAVQYSPYPPPMGYTGTIIDNRHHLSVEGAVPRDPPHWQPMAAPQPGYPSHLLRNPQEALAPPQYPPYTLMQGVPHPSRHEPPSRAQPDPHHYPPAPFHMQ